MLSIHLTFSPNTLEVVVTLKPQSISPSPNQFYCFFFILQFWFIFHFSFPFNYSKSKSILIFTSISQLTFTFKTQINFFYHHRNQLLMSPLKLIPLIYETTLIFVSKSTGLKYALFPNFVTPRFNSSLTMLRNSTFWFFLYEFVSYFLMSFYWFRS